MTANTALTYVLIPYIYTKTDVGAGVKAPSAQLMQQLVLAQRVFTWTTLYAVKLSFLFFFRSIICRLRNLMIFWWCDFAVVILAYGACVAAGFMACSTFGPGLKGMYEVTLVHSDAFKLIDVKLQKNVTPL